MLEDPTRWLHVGQSNMLKIRGWPNDTKHHSTCLIKLMRRIGLWVRISPRVHHVVTSTDVCNMAESKEKFNRCLSVLLGSLSKRVFKTRTATGSELFSLLACLHTTTFTSLSIFSPLEMISIKIWGTPLSWHAKFSVPVAVRVSKMHMLKLPISA